LSKLFHISPQPKLLLALLLAAGLVQQVLAQAYFQQEVNFTIQVRLDDQAKELHAFESIEYINNSADTLTFIYFHLWPNAYANNNTALAKQLFLHNGKQKLFDNPDLRGSIDSLDFRVDAKPLAWQILDNIDICQVFLPRPLIPGDTILITTPFRVKIPKGVTSRLGYNGESFQISQWYPKPAVYDKDGWHQMPYLDLGEFYAEFGSYDVSITLPDNYTIGASGELQNQHELDRLDQLTSDTSWKSYPRYRRGVFPPSSQQMKTLQYKGIQIHDFAWFADKRFYVTKAKVVLPQSQKEVLIWVMFTDQQASIWKNALEYASRSILHFSEWIGDYPYNSFTVVQSSLGAGAGMEYPGLAVIGYAPDAYSLDEVIAHEAAHNWFYSALGSNERRFPFMDESMAAAYEMRYMRKYYPDMKLWQVYYKNYKLARFFKIDQMPVQMMSELEWLLQARNNLEQPINLHSNDYSYTNYSTMIYNKGGLGFNYLRAYLGDSLFDSSMQAYYRKWRFRHPDPLSLRNMFETETEKDLSWFFDDFLATTKRLDYKILRLKNNKLLVRNKGEMVAPLHIAGTDGDSVHFEKWVEGFDGKQWIPLPEGDYTKIRIDPWHNTPELFRLNNSLRTSGLFPRLEPIRTQFYFSIEDPTKPTLMYFPAVNWNKESGFMFGVGLHNGFLIPKPIEYFFIPFYSFKNNDLAGYGNVAYNLIPYESFIRKATINIEGARFAALGNQNYHKARLGLTLYLRNKKHTNPFTHTVFGNYIIASDLFQIEQLQKAQMQPFVQLAYQVEKSTLINPFSLLAFHEFNELYQKSSIEFNYRLSYFEPGKGLDVRLFAGVMLNDNSQVPFYKLSASGRSGREQYLYEGSYLDRFGEFSTTLWSRQMTLTEGGLVSPVNDSLGYSDWLVSITLTSSLPGAASRIPIKPFVNVLLNDHGINAQPNPTVFYEAGLKAGIWNLFEIYVPLLVSANIDASTGGFKDRIRIVLSLDIIQQLRRNTGFTY
jgi:hypothetical protein